MKMIVVFEKTPRLRMIGHLDLMRAMQRASDTLFFTTSDAELAKNVSTDIFPVNTSSVTCAVAVFRELGLIDDRRWAKFEKKQAQKEAEMKRAEKTVFSPTDALNEVLVSCETSPVTTGVRLSELLRRPQVDPQVALGLGLAHIVLQRFGAKAVFLRVGGAYIGADQPAGVYGIFLIHSLPSLI